MKISEINARENKLKVNEVAMRTFGMIISDQSFRNWASGTNTPSHTYKYILELAGVTDI